MKNKKLLITVSLVVAFAVLAGTAFAAQPADQGYEAFKDVIKNHKDIDHENGTITGSLQVTDNGERVFEISGVVKGSKEDNQVSGDVSIIANDLSKAIEFYGLEETMYIFDSEAGEYYQANKTQDEDFDEDFYMNERRDQEMSPEQEALMDFLMSNLKDDFTQTVNSDGSSSIEFELTKDEIPVPLNLLVSAASSKHDNFERMEDINEIELSQYPLFNDLKDIKVEMPKITDEIELEYINVNIELNEKEEVVGMSFALTISGKDEAGDFHEVSLQGSFEISNLNETIVDTPDLENKDIEVLPEISHDRRSGRPMRRH